MPARALVLALVLLAASVACARLGAWQLGRWRHARAANAAAYAALASAPVPLTDARAPLAALRGRRLLVSGEFDGRVHVLLHDRWQGEQPGIEWLTPFRFAGGGVALVDRGWLPAADGERPAADALREAGERELVALAEPLAPLPRAGAWKRLPYADGVLWSADAADPDSLRAHVPLPLAPWVLHALPGSGAPPLPRRSPPVFANESMHLSYASQWALFTLACAAGAVFVLVRARGAAR